MTTRSRRGIAALSALPLAVALTGCAEEQPKELVFDCIVQEQPNGDYKVLDPKECDNDGNGYAGSHGGVYPWIFYHGGGSYYAPGSTLPRASVPAASLAVANNTAAKTSALNATSKATGLRVGSNGVTAGKKGGFGFSKGGGGARGGVGG